VTVHPFKLETVPSDHIVNQGSVVGDLRGIAQLATVVNRALGGKGVDITAHGGAIRAARRGHGPLRAGTHLRTEPFDARGTAAGLAFEASLQADDLRVDDGDVGHTDLRVVTARVSASGEPRARVAFIAATFVSRDLDLAAPPFSDPVCAVEVNGAETESLPYWASRLPIPPELRVISGAMTVGGHLEGVAREKTCKGHVRFGEAGLGVTRTNSLVHGNATGVLRVNGSPEKRVDLFGSEVSLREVRAATRGVRLEVPSIETRATELVVGTEGVTGRVSVDAPVVQVPSLSAVGALLSLPEDIAIEGGHASARVRLDIDLVRLVGEGEVAIAARGLRLRIGAQRMAGDLTVALNGKPEGAVTDLSGSQVAFKSDVAAKTLDWWGRVRLHQATFGVRPGLLFRTYVSATAKDGSTLTALVADSTALPQWFIDAVLTKSLEATGELLVTPSIFAVRSVEAHAQGADVGFELGKIRTRRRSGRCSSISASRSRASTSPTGRPRSCSSARRRGSTQRWRCSRRSSGAASEVFPRRS
jgi:hypothetical protein